VERKGIMAWNEVSEVDSSKGIYTVCGKLWLGMYVCNLYVCELYMLALLLAHTRHKSIPFLDSFYGRGL